MNYVPTGKDAKEIEEDIKVAENTRRRRRRRNRRRAARQQPTIPARLRGPNARPAIRPNQRTYRHSVEAENKLEEEVKEEIIDPALTVRVKDLLSPELTKFCEAVVHPFGNNAIGATYPDRYQELVVPLTDRLELDFSAAAFNFAGNWVDAPGLVLESVVMWFEPRCTAVGSLDYFTNTGGQPPDVWNMFPYVVLDDTLSIVGTNTAPEQVTSGYYLCFTGVWSTSSGQNDAVTYGLYDENYPSLIRPMHAKITYTRFNNILSNISKMRVLGAGIKMWSEEAPINTGGYSVGGWATLADIYEAMRVQSPTATTIEPVNPGALKNFQPKVRFACRSPGVKGSTVRYSCLQDPEQLDAEYPQLTPMMVEAVSDNIVSYITPPLAVVTNSRNQTVAAYDMMQPGSYVPIIIWQFNVATNAGDNSTQNNYYTLKIMSMVHSEGTPTGDSPFQSEKSNCDPLADKAKAMLENPEIFPVATKGHSFKSFMTKTNRVVAKVSRVASSVAKFMKLAEEFGTKMAPK